MVQRGIPRKIVTTIFVLAAAGALSACVTASRFVPGSTNEVPLEMALKAVKEGRSIVYFTGNYTDQPGIILLVEKNSGMAFKDSDMSFVPFAIAKDELVEILRREARVDHARETSEFHTPDGKLVAYAVPKDLLFTITVDTEKNEFTVSHVDGPEPFVNPSVIPGGGDAG